MEASKNAILDDGQGIRKNFADAVRQCKDYMETTGNANSINGNNRNTSAINGDRGGRGGGRGFQAEDPMANVVVVDKEKPAGAGQRRNGIKTWLTSAMILPSRRTQVICIIILT